MAASYKQKTYKRTARNSHSPNRSSYKGNKGKSSKNQVRIIGGCFKRRLIGFIDADGLRPTPDRLRETLFNWITPNLMGAMVLDSCAGSGALGFEALSRGAAQVIFIEANAQQAGMLNETAQTLDLIKDSYDVMYAKAEKAIATMELNTYSSFDIVFIDPPYALQLHSIIIKKLIEVHAVTSHTLIYIEDDKDIKQTLQNITISYSVLKTVQIGQITGSIIQLSIDPEQ